MAIRQLSDVLGTGRPGSVAAGHGVVHGQRDERSRVLTAFGQEVVGDGFRGGDRFDPGDALSVEFGQAGASPQPRRTAVQHVMFEHARCGTHDVHVRARCAGGRRVLKLDHVAHPVFVDRRRLALARQQRYGDARDAGQQYLVDGFFQHVQAGDAQDGIDVPAEDDLHDDR